jgi:predicted transcriptional regulator
MRTTLYLPDDLLKKAKRQAAESRRTLTAVIEDALREALARRTQKVRGKPARLTTFGGGGFQPAVDLDDAASLIDIPYSAD